MKFNYCPQCGHQGTVKPESKTKSHCQNCGTDFWNNPRATVAVVFRNGDKLLFAKRGIEPNKGKYDFPGGFLEYNESAERAVVREIHEETGVRVKPGDLELLAAYTYEYLPGTSVMDLVFLVKRWQGSFQPQDDVAGLEWKPIDFINSDQFVPPYKELSLILKT